MIKRLNKIFFIFICILLLKSHSHAFDIKARTAILQDFSSGEILFEKEPDREIYPASMTKIMTSIVAFELLENGELSLDEVNIPYIDTICHFELFYQICNQCNFCQEFQHHPNKS